MKKLFLIGSLLILLVAFAFAGGQKDQVAPTAPAAPVAAAAAVELKWYQPEPVGHPWTDVGR
jgi:hypothetical protein